jgi:hypothetical protein
VSQLVVAPEGSGDGYSRDLFEHWVDEDGDGCATRCEVLFAERWPVLPGLPGGGWLSAYDGYSTDDPSELDIDHVVALAEAWRSGASAWDEDRRRAFANDLVEPGALIAVTAATNRSKSDRDPARWQPPRREFWCSYVGDWARVKLRWGLTADPAEVAALTNMANGC